MATTAALCNSFKQELLAMTPHAAGDVYKIALYTDAAASLSSATTAYTATGEITGTGYTAGGMNLAGNRPAVTGTGSARLQSGTRAAR